MPADVEILWNAQADQIDGNTLTGTAPAALNAVLDNTGRTIFYSKDAADATAATATTEKVITRAPFKCRVVSAYFIGDTASTITADGTNNATITLSSNAGAGGASTAVATYTSDVAGGNLAALVPKLLTLVPAAAAIASGSILTFKITKSGTGVVVPTGKLVILLQRTP